MTDETGDICLSYLLRSERCKADILANDKHAIPRKDGKVYFLDLLIFTIQRLQRYSLLDMFDKGVAPTLTSLVAVGVERELGFVGNTALSMANTLVAFCKGAENPNIPPAWKEIEYSYDKLHSLLLTTTSRAQDVASALELFRHSCSLFEKLTVLQKADCPLRWCGLDYRKVWTSVGAPTFNLTLGPGA